MEGSVPPALPLTGSGMEGREEGRTRHAVNLALQGGGTHGAFTWGVLDRLLEEEWLEIAAISGTSAGAINGALVTQGLAEGGPARAKALLDRFWWGLAQRLSFSPLRNTPLEKAFWGYDLSYSLAWQAFDTLTRVFSPYQMNPTPLDLNPLREALAEVLDPIRLRRDPGGPKLFVSATNVRTGKARVFERPEIGVEALLASACLPQIFKAVEIDGEAFWDGGFLGNPPLWPLYGRGSPPDIVLVQINPLTRPDIPYTASDIMTRMQEIGFNASLMYEMRAVAFVQRLLANGALNDPRYGQLYIHMIEDEELLRNFGVSSKYNGEGEFLAALKRHGREAAERWLRDGSGVLGRANGVDLRERFL